MSRIQLAPAREIRDRSLATGFLLLAMIGLFHVQTVIFGSFSKDWILDWMFVGVFLFMVATFIVTSLICWWRGTRSTS